MKSKLYMFLGALVVFGLSLAPMAGAVDKLSGHYRGSEFMNMNVENDRGEHLGFVRDFVFDRNGDLSYLVVSSTTAGDQLIPIPYDTGMVTFRDDSVIVYNLDKSRLDAAPTISSYDWSRLDDPNFEESVHGYYSDSGRVRGYQETPAQGDVTGSDLKQSPVTSGEHLIPRSF